MDKIIIAGALICFFLILFTGVVILSPGGDAHPDLATTQTKLISSSDLLKVVEFDGHEYVILRVDNGGSICHKANCKFCEE